MMRGFVTLQVNTDDRHLTERGAVKNNTMLKVQHEDLFEMHRWNHVCVVLNKSMMRNSTAQVYINAQLVKSSKVRHPFTFIFFIFISRMICVQSYNSKKILYKFFLFTIVIEDDLLLPC